MTDEQFTLLREDMKEFRTEVRVSFAQLNGRVRETEQGLAVLKDRDGRKAMAWGTGASAAIIGIVEAVRAYFK